MLRNALVSNVNNMIGLATARALADYNVRVYALAYKQDVNDKNIKIISIDAYDYSTVNNAVKGYTEGYHEQ